MERTIVVREIMIEQPVFSQEQAKLTDAREHPYQHLNQLVSLDDLSDLNFSLARGNAGASDAHLPQVWLAHNITSGGKISPGDFPALLNGHDGKPSALYTAINTARGRAPDGFIEKTDLHAFLLAASRQGELFDKYEPDKPDSKYNKEFVHEAQNLMDYFSNFARGGYITTDSLQEAVASGTYGPKEVDFNEVYIMNAANSINRNAQQAMDPYGMYNEDACEQIDNVMAKGLADTGMSRVDFILQINDRLEKMESPYRYALRGGYNHLVHAGEPWG